VVTKVRALLQGVHFRISVISWKGLLDIAGSCKEYHPPDASAPRLFRIDDLMLFEVNRSACWVLSAHKKNHSVVNAAQYEPNGIGYVLNFAKTALRKKG
jgi:hypothetical protein